MEGSRVLVVDDDRTHLLFLDKLLVREGFEVVKAPDGSAAMAILEADSVFDAVVLDLNMPGLNGMEVLSRMKQSDALMGIPVVLQTARDAMGDILEGLRAGARFYLTKPLDAGMLVGVVRAAIDEGDCRRQCWCQLGSTTSTLGLMQKGRFHFQTLAHCQDLATALALTCPDPKRVVVGLSELLINAIEHGNLEIGYAEKTHLVDARTWREEVERRQQLPAYSSRKAVLEFTRLSNRLRIRIQDCGKGFPWRDFMSPNPDRVFDNHGRGILLAKWEAFDRLEYQDPGNCVILEIKLSKAH